MMNFLFFLIGLLLGGITGVVLMCLVQFNRIKQFERGVDYEKENCR